MQSFAEIQNAYEDAKKILASVADSDIADFAKMKPVSGLVLLAVMAQMDEENTARVAVRAQAMLKEELSRRGREAANKRHDGDDGSRIKLAKVLKAWTSGKYRTRDECALHMSETLGISFATARRALRKSPAPKKDLAAAGKD